MSKISKTSGCPFYSILCAYSISTIDLIITIIRPHRNPQREMRPIATHSAWSVCLCVGHKRKNRTATDLYNAGLWRTDRRTDGRILWVQNALRVIHTVNKIEWLLRETRNVICYMYNECTAARVDWVYYNSDHYAMKLSIYPSVCLSVCLSQTVCLHVPCS